MEFPWHLGIYNYQKFVDANRDNVFTPDEILDSDLDGRITFKEVEKWFWKNFDSIREEDKKNIATALLNNSLGITDIWVWDEYTPLISPKDEMHLLAIPNFFGSEIIQKTIPDQAQKELDNLFATAVWGFGNRTGKENTGEIVAKFGDFSIPTCMKYARLGDLSQRKTAVATLIGLAHEGARLDRVFDTLIDVYVNDEDSYVKELAENALKRATSGSLSEFSLLNENQILKLSSSSNRQIKKYAIDILMGSYSEGSDESVKSGLERILYDKEEDPYFRSRITLSASNFWGSCNLVSHFIKDPNESINFKKYLASYGLNKLLHLTLKSKALIDDPSAHLRELEKLSEDYTQFIRSLNSEDQNEVENNGGKNVKLLIAHQYSRNGVKNHETRNFEDAKKYFTKSRELFPNYFNVILMPDNHREEVTHLIFISTRNRNTVTTINSSGNIIDYSQFQYTSPTGLKEESEKIRDILKARPDYLQDP